MVEQLLIASMPVQNWHVLVLQLTLIPKKFEINKEMCFSQHYSGVFTVKQGDQNCNNIEQNITHRQRKSESHKSDVGK